jgi:Xaa-Pro aminopeptidase
VSNLGLLQEELRASRLDGVLLPSTDEYLSEFSQPFAQRLAWATGFSGSTGTAIVLPDRAALFLDSRYAVQGGQETAGLGIEVLAPGDLGDWLVRHVATGSRVGIETRLQPYSEVVDLVRLAADHGIEVVELDAHPVDAVWRNGRPAEPGSPILAYPLEVAGLSAAEKCGELRRHLTESGLDVFVVADPEDAAWLLNVRTHDSRVPTPTGWHVVPIPLTRVIVEAAGPVTWFVDRDRVTSGVMAELDGIVEIPIPRCSTRCSGNGPPVAPWARPSSAPRTGSVPSRSEAAPSATITSCRAGDGSSTPPRSTARAADTTSTRSPSSDSWPGSANPSPAPP